MSTISNIQPTIVSGDPLANTAIRCDICRQTQVHAIGYTEGQYWLECLGCNGTQSFKFCKSLFHRLREAIPPGGSMLGAIIMR